VVAGVFSLDRERAMKMKCPGCGSEESFTISAHAIVKIDSEGNEGFSEDLNWSDDDDCECDECNFAANVGNFKQTAERVQKENYHPQQLTLF